MPFVLAIDQSTSATKAVLFDPAGSVLDKASREHRQIYPQPGWVEHDPEEIWQNVLAVIREVAKRNRDALPHLACLSIANQRETILIFDRATGRPLHNAIVWQDRRGEPICRALAAHTDSIRHKTGLKLDTYFSASKLKWLIQQRPHLAAKLQTGEAIVGTIDTYLIHRLTRGRVFATDHTNASRTLLFDIARLRWDEQLCKLFDVPLHALPEIRESAALFGETDADGALPRPVPIAGLMGDSQASLFAQRCYEPGQVKATFGTGTSILLNIGEHPHVAEHGAVTALAWVLHGKPTYAFEGIINYSAATLEWLKNQLGLIQSASEAETLATTIPDNGGVYLVPAFAGLSAPHWAPEARAAIVGLTAHSRKEHIVRAALESIAYQIRDVLDRMRTDAGVALSSLHADGGPTCNRFLMQFSADITGAELKVSEVAEASAWGAAACGLLGLGLVESLDALSALPREVTSYYPQMKSEDVNQNYSGWQTAVKRVL